MILSKKCESLIKEGYAYRVSFGNELTNHLPMALIALDRMKAKEDDLQRFLDNYKKNLEPFPINIDLKKVISIENHFGDQTYFSAYLDFFQDEISSKGITKVLDETIPLLIKNPSPCAFHCLIRTSYAVSSGMHHEIAMALAYWASEFFKFKTKVLVEKKDPLDMLESLSARFHNHDFAPGNISDRMMEVDDLLFKLENHIISPEYSLSSIAEFVLNLYAQTENFTLLHAITATHAFRTLLPYIDNKNLALQYLWQGIVLAFFSTKTPLPSFSTNNETLQITWEEIFRRAVKSNDAHTIKLIYTSWEEWKEYGNDLYIEIAYKKLLN